MLELGGPEKAITLPIGLGFCTLWVCWLLGLLPPHTYHIRPPTTPISGLDLVLVTWPPMRGKGSHPWSCVLFGHLVTWSVTWLNLVWSPGHLTWSVTLVGLVWSPGHPWSCVLSWSAWFVLVVLVVLRGVLCGVVLCCVCVVLCCVLCWLCWCCVVSCVVLCCVVFASCCVALVSRGVVA